MKLQSAPFQKISNAEKTIEVRLNDEKRQQIQVGDEIEFSENDHPENSLLTQVKELIHESTFEQLYASRNPALFGGENAGGLLQEIRQFYSIDDEKKYGVVGIRIELIDENKESR